jgi:hemolysin III
VRSDYCDAELAADHIVHVVALTAGTAGTLAMLAQAAVSTELPIFCALAVYSLALLAMLGASAAHNAGRGHGNEVIRRLDHAAIFLLMAGTYTPFAIRFLSDEMASAVTAGDWCAALAGAAMKLRHPGRFERLSILLYLTLGWQGLFLFPSLLASLPQPAPLLIVTGADSIRSA